MTAFASTNCHDRPACLVAERTVTSHPLAVHLLPRHMPRASHQPLTAATETHTHTTIRPQHLHNRAEAPCTWTLETSTVPIARSTGLLELPALSEITTEHSSTSHSSRVQAGLQVLAHPQRPLHLSGGSAADQKPASKTICGLPALIVLVLLVVRRMSARLCQTPYCDQNLRQPLLPPCLPYALHLSGRCERECPPRL